MTMPCHTALIALSLSVTSFPTSVKKGKIFFAVTLMHVLETWMILQKMSLGFLIVDGVCEREHVLRRSDRDHTVNKFGSELIELCHGFK